MTDDIRQYAVTIDEFLKPTAAERVVELQRQLADAADTAKALMRCAEAADYGSMQWRADLDQLVFELCRVLRGEP
jgi:hypothetical protein